MPNLYTVIQWAPGKKPSREFLDANLEKSDMGATGWRLFPAFRTICKNEEGTEHLFEKRKFSIKWGPTEDGVSLGVFKRV